jgi:hypothetical protein
MKLNGRSLLYQHSVLCQTGMPYRNPGTAFASGTASRGSRVGLDIYMWLAHRLHRVPPIKPQFIPWTAIKEQFGWGYAKMSSFKEVFRDTLRIVKTQYPGARYALDGKGMVLHNSAPPVSKRIYAVSSAPRRP